MKFKIADDYGLCRYIFFLLLYRIYFQEEQMGSCLGPLGQAG